MLWKVMGLYIMQEFTRVNYPIKYDVLNSTWGIKKNEMAIIFDKINKSRKTDPASASPQVAKE